MKYKAKKHFGQNFLQDSTVIDAILHAFGPKPSDQVVEIGPGLGALTKPLLHQLPHLSIIEIDRELQLYWQTYAKTHEHTLTVIADDALLVDYAQLGTPIRLIGNLPYNVATPILIHLLQFSNIVDMHFMLQKEVVDRLCASPGSKSYGRLSILMQYHATAIPLFTVPPEAFDPRPKVNSAVVRIIPFAKSPYQHVPFSDLEKIVAMAFHMRRKTIANNLKSILTAHELQDLGVNPSDRAEQLTIETYIRITQAKSCKK